METINPIDPVVHLIAQAIERWRLTVKPEEVDALIKSKLDKTKDEIILKLLGFNRDFGGRYWELDHCNGRAGESAAGQYLRDVQAEAIKKWLAKVSMPTLSAAEEKQIKKSVKEDYIRHIKQGLRDAVYRKAQEDLETLIQQVTGSNQLENLEKVRQLLMLPTVPEITP